MSELQSRRAFHVREARPDDAAGIVDILNPIIKAGLYTVLDRHLTPEFERGFISGFPKRGVFHVAECLDRPRLLGLQTVEPFADYTRAYDHVGVIGTYVDLTQRRRGVGVRLSEATFSAVSEKGFEKLFTYVRVDNEAALDFYIALGFGVVGRAERQVKLGSTYVDEVVIEKALTSERC